MSSPLLSATGLCVAGAVLEALFAGRGIRRRLAGLPTVRPALLGLGRHRPGLLRGLLRGGYRLFAAPEPTALTYAALALLGALMFVNAFWNYFFFRRRNTYQAFLVSVPYSLVALSLFGLLSWADPVAAGYLAPYLVYLLYGNAWGYRVWKLNPPPEGPVE